MPQVPIDFRGFIAPASLKHFGVGSGVTTGRGDFRGFIAPASLKPVHLAHDVVLGHLEISGASSPRPH